MSQNEIDAAKSVRMDYLNTQGQPKFAWPATFALARAYVDQLERSAGRSGGSISSVRKQLAEAENAAGAKRSKALGSLAAKLSGEMSRSSDAAKLRKSATAVRELSAAKY